MSCLEKCASMQCCRCLLDTMGAFEGVLLLKGVVFTIEHRDCCLFIFFVFVFKISIHTKIYINVNWMIKLQSQNSWMAVKAWQHSVVERGWFFHTWMVREPCDCSGKSARVQMWDMHWKSIGCQRFVFPELGGCTVTSNIWRALSMIPILWKLSPLFF